MPVLLKLQISTYSLSTLPFDEIEKTYNKSQRYTGVYFGYCYVFSVMQWHSITPCDSCVVSTHVVLTAAAE